MDPISQAALGAAVAQTAGQHKLGFKVVVAGAIAGAMPDIDVFFSIGRGYFTQLELHRGVTHSIFFAFIAGPTIAYLLWKFEARSFSTIKTKKHAQRLNYWIAAITLAILSHPLLDVLTPYGTQLLAPFSERRFAVFAMPIIDPIYTLILLVGLILAWYNKHKAQVQQIGIATMLVSSTYLLAGWYLGAEASREAERQLAQQGIYNAQVSSFPTILQLHYRRVVARTKTHDRVGYISMWHPCPIDWGIVEREPQSNFSAIEDMPRIKTFEWFTMGWTHKYSYTKNGATHYRMVDLRYGTDNNPLASLFSIKAEPAGNTIRVSPAGSRRDAGALLGELAAQAYPSDCKISIAHNKNDEASLSLAYSGIYTQQ